MKGTTCPHGEPGQDTVQLTPLESFITVALMDAALPPSMVCGDGVETLTEIGALPPQPESDMAKSNAKMYEWAQGNRDIKTSRKRQSEPLKKKGKRLGQWTECNTHENKQQEEDVPVWLQ